MTLAHVHRVAFEGIETLNEPVDGLSVEDPSARGVRTPISTGWRVSSTNGHGKTLDFQTPAERFSEYVASIPWAESAFRSLAMPIRNDFRHIRSYPARRKTADERAAFERSGSELFLYCAVCGLKS
jgi:hypothetical protein